MKRLSFILFILFILFLTSCNKYNNRSYFNQSEIIDSLLLEGVNHYDIASYLYEHPYYLYVPIEDDHENYSVQTSTDRNFRVYSIVSYDYSHANVHNIFHYRDVGADDIYIKADAGDSGCIIDIGMNRNGNKTYYLLVSQYVSLHQGIFITYMISAFSLTEGILNALEREPIFVTKDGRHLETIEVFWADDHGDIFDRNLWGIQIDKKDYTQEIRIQVIGSKTGKALDQAIIYKWDGSNYVFSEMKPLEK